MLLATLIVSAVLPAEQYYLVHQHMVGVAAEALARAARAAAAALAAVARLRQKMVK